MLTVTPRFLPALTLSHNQAGRVDVLQGVTLLLSGVPYEDGTVTADAGSDVRYSMTLTVSDPSLLPFDPADFLAPYGQALHPYQGLTYTDGTTEVVPCGVHVITQVSGDRDTGPVTVTAKGREVVVQAARFTASWDTRGFGSHVDAISAAVITVMPAVVVDDRTTHDRTPAYRVWKAGDDRWSACRELAKAIGASCYFDAVGTLVVADLPPAPDGATPVWDVAAGPGGVQVSAGWGLSSDGLYNGVRASGQNSTDNVAPVTDLVVDTDPTSPTRWGGPLGQRLLTYESPLLITTGDCTVAAEGLLRTGIGLKTTVDLQSVPNPALEPGDCVRTIYTDGTRTLHIVRSLTIPLGDGPCSIKTMSAADDPEP
ncbi:hypothetical protein B4N89_27930 [Embleya scabrispora]|uniref:DUF5047 domain-containing protein n=1 Tax=Embleya scabrispora TaxID=159449 RepID=A0A1T3P584_9ACTN|nr:DUF5047 domain-containing protein [Embleya scabrispora]OPC84248.1 hypothetical protein B4N89_27930 [Embleya scabrispora]